MPNEEMQKKTQKSLVSKKKFVPLPRCCLINSIEILTNTGIRAPFRLLSPICRPELFPLYRLDKTVVSFVRHLSPLLDKTASFWRLFLFAYISTYSETKLQKFNPLGDYAEHVCLRGGKYVRPRCARALLRVVPQYNAGFNKF
jgi:hypothetical protein